MLAGMLTSSNALVAYQTSLDNTSNNLANVNTTAFKRTVVNFQDFVYSGGPDRQVGNGVKITSVTPTGFAQGAFEDTGNDTDFMINGRGLIQVMTGDGAIQYTRDGSFHRDASNRLVNNSGCTLQPEIVIPSDTLTMTISPLGVVSVLTSSSPSTPKVIGQMQLANFPNQEALTLESGNMYSESMNSGPPTLGLPGAGGLGKIQQGGLERSNVDVTTELTSLLSSQHGYSANSRVISTTNQMILSTIQMIQ